MKDSPTNYVGESFSFIFLWRSAYLSLAKILNTGYNG
jgi:hypothetical protein